MEVLSEKSIALLAFLLPGFLAAWIFYGLTAHPRKEAFDRLVQALIFTFLTRVEVIGVHKLWGAWWHPRHPGGNWTDSMELVWSAFGAAATGVIVASLANSDRAHAALRVLRVTERTSYPSEWYSGFHRFKREVILHLKGERRLRGWADEWPDQPDRGHFLIQKPQWVDEHGENYPQVQIERLMIPATEVEMVEFLVAVKDLQDLGEARDQVTALAALHPKKESDERHAKPGQDIGE